jgi:hypothetical protein
LNALASNPFFGKCQIGQDSQLHGIGQDVIYGWRIFRRISNVVPVSLCEIGQNSHFMESAKRFRPREDDDFCQEKLHAYESKQKKQQTAKQFFLSKKIMIIECVYLRHKTFWKWCVFRGQWRKQKWDYSKLNMNQNTFLCFVSK